MASKNTPAGLDAPLLQRSETEFTMPRSKKTTEYIELTPTSPTFGADRAFDYLFKFLLVGDEATGKSCILTKYVGNSFEEQYIQTIGVDFKIRTEIIDDITIKLQIWDATGQQRFRLITASYYKGAHVFLIVFDVTNMQSFENVQQHLREIDEFSNAEHTFCKILIGNKTDKDKERVVSFQQAQSMATQHKLEYMEVSAKTGLNVKQMFRYAASYAVSNKRRYDQQRMISLDSSSSGKKSAKSFASSSSSASGVPRPCSCCVVL